jgi:hypothetical protein
LSVQLSIASKIADSSPGVDSMAPGVGCSPTPGLIGRQMFLHAGAAGSPPPSRLMA